MPRLSRISLWVMYMRILNIPKGLINLLSILGTVLPITIENPNVQKQRLIHQHEDRILQNIMIYVVTEYCLILEVI